MTFILAVFTECDDVGIGTTASKYSVTSNWVVICMQCSNTEAFIATSSEVGLQVNTENN